ncbi:MAG TPA: hypothetical protein VGE55_10135 [Limnobacter sp.]
MNKTVPNTHHAPLRVLIPNILVPEAALARLQRSQGAKGQGQSPGQIFQGLPPGLLQVMARSLPDMHQPAGHLDRVEAWLLNCLDPDGLAKFDQYPAWAMLNAQAADFTRFFGTVGNLELNRDGVQFTPPEVLQVGQADLAAFWAVVQGELAAQGWRVEGTPGFHTALSNNTPLPMEQASPWSVQGIRLTDYLPMSDDCAAWRRMWLNLQVELHNAPFNQAREQRGLKPLNALWFWGGGRAWEATEALPTVKAVGADGVFDAVKITDAGGEALNRLVFWTQLLKGAHASETSPSTVYVVDFDGWGGTTSAFKVLEDEVLQPMRLAGLAFDWTLMGQHGWRTARSGWAQRLKFWQRQPNWLHLAEPEPDGLPTEDDLQAAYQRGQQEQDQLNAMLLGEFEPQPGVGKARP